MEIVRQFNSEVSLFLMSVHPPLFWMARVLIDDKNYTYFRFWISLAVHDLRNKTADFSQGRGFPWQGSTDMSYLGSNVSKNTKYSSPIGPDRLLFI